MRENAVILAFVESKLDIPDDRTAA